MEKVIRVMDVSAQMLVFVKVVEFGSISAASRQSGHTPSALSKQIGHLEDHVGHRLLRRTKSGVSLTPEGHEFYQKCRAVAEKVREAEEHISAIDVHPKGVLRVASSVAFGKSQLIKMLPSFLERYPEMNISLELTDRRIDLDEENFDVAVNFAEQLTDPNLIVRKIMKNNRVLVASPAFIERFGIPKTFSDLENFNCLRTSNSFGRNAWRAELDGEVYTVDASGNFEGNSAHAVYLAALAGLGIARLSTYLVADKIESGKLVRLFENYKQDYADVAVTYADKRNLPPRTRAFIDFLIEAFRNVEPMLEDGSSSS